MKSIFCGFALSFAGMGIAQAAPPLAAYGQLPAVEDMVLSPDGKSFAFVAVEGDKRRLFVRTTEGAALQVVNIGNLKVRRLRWAGDDHILVFISLTMHDWFVSSRAEFENETVLSISIKTGKVFRVFANKPQAVGQVMDYYGSSRIGDHRYGYFESQLMSQGYDHGLFQVDLDSGDLKIIAENGPQRYKWVLNAEGRVVARTGYDARRNLWSLLPGDHQDNAVFTRSTDIPQLSAEGLGRTPNTVVVLDDEESAHSISEITLDGSKPPQVLFDKMAPTELVRSPSTRVLLGGIDSDHSAFMFFDPVLQERYAAAIKPFSKYHVTLQSFDTAFDRLILFTDGADDAGTYWMVDLTKGSAAELTEAYPLVKPADVGPTRLVSYKAADGLTLQGVLTLPPDRPAQKLAFVVLPHGGPIGLYDSIKFDWWAQAIASRGYAVFQPNYRGSGGAGAALQAAGDGQWGRKMQTDLSDGVTFLAGQGVIDPKRGCIVGGSYGGYAALAGVTIQHGLYRCAISYGGVSDLGDMLYRAHGNIRESARGRYMRRAMGATWSGDPVLRTYSPRYQADKADAPILLIHGKDDTVVPILQSQVMETALRSAGKSVTLLQLDGEDHWLSTATTRNQMLQASVDFLIKHNSPS